MLFSWNKVIIIIIYSLYKFINCDIYSQVWHLSTEVVYFLNTYIIIIIFIIT